MAKAKQRTEPRRREPDERSPLVAALLAGSFAIAVNTALLALADAVDFTTARGGLLRLIRDLAGRAALALGLGDLWTDTLAPATTGPAFQTGFHIFVGVLMAVFYALVLEPVLPGKPLVKGLLYAALVWLLNAFVVLPATGEGVAGSSHLGLAGMVGFAVIHIVFFVLLALFYARLRGGARKGLS
jgi:hypothetical protein